MVSSFQLVVTGLVNSLSFVWFSIPPPYLFWIEVFCSSGLLPPAWEQEKGENRIKQQLLIGVPYALLLSVSHFHCHLELRSHHFKNENKNKTCWYTRFSVSWFLCRLSRSVTCLRQVPPALAMHAAMLTAATLTAQLWLWSLKALKYLTVYTAEYCSCRSLYIHTQQTGCGTYHSLLHQYHACFASWCWVN